MITKASNTEPIDITKYKEQKDKLATGELTRYEPQNISQPFPYIDIINNVMRLIAFSTHSSERDDMNMDWQEKYLDKLDRDISEMKNKLDRNISDMQSSLMTTEDRISSMISQTLGEMRDRDNQSQSDMKDIRNFMIEERRWIIAMAVATILGIATMVITVLIS